MLKATILRVDPILVLCKCFRQATNAEDGQELLILKSCSSSFKHPVGPLELVKTMEV